MRPHNIIVIQVYATASDHEDEEVEQYYEQLDSIIAKDSQEEYTCSSRQLECHSNTGQGQREDLALEGQVTEDGYSLSPPTHPCQHSPSPKVVDDSNLAYP